MADDSSEAPAATRPQIPRQKEHGGATSSRRSCCARRTNDRVTRAFIDAALRRARGEQDTEETNHRRNVTER